MGDRSTLSDLERVTFGERSITLDEKLINSENRLIHSHSLSHSHSHAQFTLVLLVIDARRYPKKDLKRERERKRAERGGLLEIKNW